MSERADLDRTMRRMWAPSGSSHDKVVRILRDGLLTAEGDVWKRSRKAMAPVFTPRHAKGLSTCCHGEEPHAVGWRFINERRAVNLDPNCGWAQGKADVLYVADAFEVMAKVNALL